MTTEAPKLRALICEDEGMTVMMLRNALQRAGYEVVGEAVDGDKGFELACKLKPDFVLMDVTMAGANGIDATRRIMQENPLPVIMLTAYSDEKLVEEALEAGACYYLVKPIVSEQLIPAVKTAIARFEAMESVKKENDTLKDALETRKLVERAKGILMDRKQMSEADAFRRMQKMSRDRCQTMKQTAMEIIQADTVFS